MDKIDKKEELKLLCSVPELEEHWNITASPKNNNVQSRYLRNPKKKKQCQIMDMGIFCLINDITPNMLNMGIRHIKETASLLTDQKIEDKSKIVIMSEEDYERYKEYKLYDDYRKINKK